MAETSSGDAFDKIIAGAVLTVAKVFVKGGLTPTNAVKLAGPAMILGGLNARVLRDLGVPARTVAQWREDIGKGAAGVADLDHPPAEVINELLAAMGLPFRVVDS